MTICGGGPPKSLIVAAGTGLPVAMYILADGGVASISTALIAGGVVAGISVFAYNYYEADFSITKMIGGGVTGTAKGLFCAVF